MRWQPARCSRRSPPHAKALVRTMSAWRLPGTSGLAALKSATENSTPPSQRRRRTGPRSDSGTEKRRRATPNGAVQGDGGFESGHGIEPHAAPISVTTVGRSGSGARGESRLAEKRRLFETDCRRGQRRLRRRRPRAASVHRYSCRSARGAVWPARSRRSIRSAAGYHADTVENRGALRVS